MSVSADARALPAGMICYRIDVADAHAHLFEVTLHVPRPAAEQRLSLPAWIPGSYLVREFARHVSALRARQGTREVPLEQLDKATWLARCNGVAKLVVVYRVYAFDTSVRCAYLDAGRGFFNGTGVCLRVHGREDEPHALALGRLPAGWQAATAMPAMPGDGGGGALRFQTADYDELVDHPVELGRFWRGAFSARGVPHEVVVSGALPRFDGERLLADAKRVCEAAIAFWHGPQAGAADVPFARYVFLLNALDDGHGGLEHRASTALVAPRRDLPRLGDVSTNDGYAALLGLVSHEYFHAWNVKRLRPAEFARYDYAQENYTALLWFFEGFTSYYDDLLLRRAGLIDEARYLGLLARTATAVQGTPGRRTQSVAAASFDAWVKYYRADENTPNATVSYYAKGALVALALDLSLRAATAGAASLDAVLRSLWRSSGGGPIGEDDIAAAVREAGGRRHGARLAADLRAWVHGTGDLPLAALLGAAGVDWRAQPPTLAQRWGLRASESPLTGVKTTAVLRGGAAERAGLAAGDELLAVDGWRLRRLDDAAALLDLADPRATAELVVARDQRLRTLRLHTAGDAGAGAVQLVAQDKPRAAALALRRAWLAG